MGHNLYSKLFAQKKNLIIQFVLHKHLHYAYFKNQWPIHYLHNIFKNVYKKEKQKRTELNKDFVYN